MKHRYLLLALFLAVAALPINQVSAATCNDIKFVFARGSGGQLGDKDEQAWHAAMSNIAEKTSLKYDFYELGSSSYGGYQYPAVEIGNGSIKGVATLLGAYIGAGETFKFGDSVDQGVGELKAYIKQTATSCPNTKFVIGGYSQGAQVISKTLPDLNSNKIIYAATFGDPKLYLPEGQGLIPKACYGENLSEYRAYVPDCRAYEGILGSYRPYQPSGYSGKVGMWCNTGDIMCSSKLSLPDHLAYDSDGLYENAAMVVANKLATIFPTAAGKLAHTSGQDTAILIDSTGSMSGLINAYKKEALRLAKETFDSGGRVALYEYRDLNDPFEPVEHCDFTCDYDQFVNELDKIKTDGGGDTAESALSASLSVMNKLEWQRGATKSLVILTDANYLNPDRDGVTLNDVVKRSKEIDPVNFYIITPNTSSYEELASLTGGAVFNSTGDLQISTDLILNRKNVTLEPDAKEIQKANIKNLSSKTINTTTFEISFTPSANTDRTLVIVNDVILGYTTENTFTLGNVAGSSTVRLVPISNNNTRGNASEITLKITPKAPNTGTQ